MLRREYALTAVVFGLATGEFVIAGLLPDVAHDLDVGIPAAGLLVTAYGIGMILGGPLVTVATARLPRRRLVAGLLGFAVLANLASALAPGFTWLLVGRLAAGLVVATFFAVAVATAVALAEPGKEAVSVGRVTLGLNLGIVLGTPLGTLVGQLAGWRTAFAAVAALLLVALLLVLRGVPVDVVPPSTSARAELRVLRDPSVVWALALTAVGNVGVVAVFTYLAPLLTDVAGFAPSATAVLLLVYGVGAVVGNQLGGRWWDRFGARALVAMLLGLAVVLGAAWAAATVRPAVVVLLFGFGVLAFAILPGMQTRVVTAAADAPTLAVAVNASGFQIAAALAGWVGGRVIDDAGLRAVYLAGAVLTLAGVAVAVGVVRRDRRLRPAPA